MNALLNNIVRFDQHVPAGLPAAANDTSHQNISLDSLLVANPQSTVLFRVKGESMIGAGIFDGDLLVVDRSIEPRHGQIVVASINDEFTIKRLHLQLGEVKLVAENPNFQDITFGELDELSVWGVVRYSLRRF